MPLHPQIIKVLELIRRADHPAFHRLTVAQARAAYEMSAPILDMQPLPLHRVQDGSLPARDGTPLAYRLYLPAEPSWAAPLPVLLYLHGGGFTVGSVNTHDALCRMLAQQAGCAVLSLDYRLAPEHRFPTAVEDAFDALCWLLAEAPSLGLDPERMAIGGDSAGGTLAAVCAILARDAGLPLRLQLLIYPGTCANQDTDSHSRLAEGYLLSRDTILWFFQHYLPSPKIRQDWRFAPLDGHGKGADVQGVAPAWVAVAEYDPLHDEGVAYADKLRQAGVSVQLSRYEGMIHDFFKMRRFVPDVRQAHADAVAALRRAFEHD